MPPQRGHLRQGAECAALQLVVVAADEGARPPARPQRAWARVRVRVRVRVRRLGCGHAVRVRVRARAGGGGGAEG